MDWSSCGKTLASVNGVIWRYLPLLTVMPCMTGVIENAFSDPTRFGRGASGAITKKVGTVFRLVPVPRWQGKASAARVGGEMRDLLRILQFSANMVISRSLYPWDIF